MKRRGFTIVEFSLVIVLLGVMALALDNIVGDVGNISADALTWKAQSDIRHAHQLAMTTGRNHGVQFQAGGGYTVYDTDISNPVMSPLTQAPMIESLQGFDSVSIQNNFQVEFNPLGRPILGGGGSVTFVTDVGNTREVFVVDVTGAVVSNAAITQATGCSCHLCHVRQGEGDVFSF